MGAIDACLARVNAAPARVTFASELDEGDVSVRLREADGTRRECVVSAAGAIIYEPLSDLDSPSGEGDPEFQRGEEEPRARAGRSVEPALDREGAHLGWLIRRAR